LSRKLGIKSGHRVATVGAPPHFAALLEPMPEGASVRANPRARGLFDVLVVFARNERELERRFERARARLESHGGLWIAWPKQTSSLATAMRESHVRAFGLASGLVDNKICAVDEDWSGLRFVVRLQDRC